MWDILGWVGGILLILIIAASINMYFDSKKLMRKFALGLGQPERLSFKADGAIPGFAPVSLERPIIGKKRDVLLAHLEKNWGFSFENPDKGRQRVLFCLKKLWNEGSVSLMLSNPKHSDEVNIDDMLAVDIACFVALVQHACQLDLLKQEEGWGVVFLNAQRAQSNFDSWQEYVAAYIRGRTFLFAISGEAETEEFAAFRDFINTEGITAHKKIPADVDWLAQPVFKDLQVLDGVINNT